MLGSLQLRDPDARIPFPLTRADRVLTGADFDLEAVRRVKDGTFWFGEEFGPFLLHTDATGKVLDAPVPLPGVQSPQNPFLGSATPNLPASRGFEPLARSIDGKTLYPMLEGALVGDPDPRRRIINGFDLRTGMYTGKTWSYRTDAGFPNAVIGDLTALDEHRFVLIERDDFQGAEAQLVLVPAPVRREPGSPRWRAAADRERQQLPGQRRALGRSRPARRHRADHCPRPSTPLSTGPGTPSETVT